MALQTTFTHSSTVSHKEKVKYDWGKPHGLSHAELGFYVSLKFEPAEVACLLGYQNLNELSDGDYI